MAPNFMTARSISSTAALGLFIGSPATKLGKRSGCFWTSSASPSLASCANSGDCFASPKASMGGEARLITWT